MRSWTSLRICLAIACAALPSAGLAEALFVATARGYVAAGDAVGRLYEIDPASGRSKVIGDLRVGRTPVGVSGLARHPGTGVLYGITSPAIAAFPSQLVTIDTASGATTLVGPLGAAASDINFDARGRLIAWLADLHRLAEIDPATGKARPIEVPGLAGDLGGIAIDRDGSVVLAVTSGAGTLARVDIDRRVVLGEVRLEGAPFKEAMNSLTFSPQGKLLGVNSDGALPPRTVLVAIDPASGHVTKILDLPQDADGLTFVKDAPAAAAAAEQAWWLRPYALAGGAVVLVAIAIVALRRRRKPR